MSQSVDEKAHAKPESVSHTREDIGVQVAELLEEVGQNPTRRRELLALTTNLVCELIEDGSLSHGDLVECIKGKQKKLQQANNFAINTALGFVQSVEDGHRWTEAAPGADTARKNLAHCLKKCQRAAVAITDMKANRKIHEGILVIDSDGVAERFGKTPVSLDGSRTKDAKITHSVEQCVKFAVEDYAPKPAQSPIDPWQNMYNFLRRVKDRNKISPAEQTAARGISELLADVLELPVVEPTMVD